MKQNMVEKKKDSRILFSLLNIRNEHSFCLNILNRENESSTIWKGMLFS